MSRAVRIGVTGLALASVAVGGAVIGSASSGGDHTSLATLAAASAPSSEGIPAAAPPGHRKVKPVAARALHGVFTVERKGTPVTLDVQRGKVTQVDATTLRVLSRDGFEATYALTPGTKVHKAKAVAAASDIRVGSTVGVVADLAPNGAPATATNVRIAK
jgi:hypothetical protein